MSAAHWLVASFIALALHLGLAWVFVPTSSEGLGISYAEGEGEGGIEVGLGMAGSYMDLLATAEEDAPVEPVEDASPPEPVTPPEETVLEPQEPAVAPPLEVSVVTQPQTVTEPVVVAATPQPEPEPTAVPQAKPQVKPEPRAALQKATGSGSDKRAGGRNTGKTKNYFGELAAWLNRHKDYPADLKKQKIQGVVVVKFTINAVGEIQRMAVKKSSGHQRLDMAALDVLQKANPLPPIPTEMKRDTLTLSLPVDYSLITK